MSAITRLRQQIKSRKEEFKHVQSKQSENPIKTSEQSGANRNLTSLPEIPNNSITSDASDSSNDDGPRASDTESVEPAEQQEVETYLSKDEVTYKNLNFEQRGAVNLTVEGKSFCLIGPAGSGKTTTVKIMIKQAMGQGIAGTMSHLQVTDKVFREDMVSCAVLSFTNQAVRNIKSSMPKILKPNCSTIHNLLEFQPVEYSDENDCDEFGNPKDKMVFAPKYGSLWNQAGGELLPHIDLIVIEEAGSVSLELFELLISALPRPNDTQFILLGDLNQNPPVFDDAILGFKQLELPVIELTQVYRNVGLVTQLAHRILEGKPIPDKEALKLNAKTNTDSVQFIRFQKKYGFEEATKQMGIYLKKLITSGDFHEDDSVVLIPFNVKFGTVEINKWMQQGITDRDNLEVYEVIARFITSYHCIGDRVLYNRNYYRIKNITHNLTYSGKAPCNASKHLTRFGTAKKGHREEVFGIQDITSSDTKADESAEDLLERVELETAKETNQSSHIIELELVENPEFTCLVKGGSINQMIPTYCMTVHKAQGSEWKNVHLIFHHSHGIMCNREMLYTGITRARNNIKIYYSGNYTGGVTTIKQSTMYKCLINQQIAGKTLQEKLEFFRNKARAYITGGGKGKTREKLIQLKEQNKL